MTFYPLIKYLHMTLAAISVTGFVIRFGWMLRASSRLEHRLTKALPHLIDTLLLLCGVSLMVLSQQYPWAVSWLAMKLFLLLLYILCGTFALKRAPTAALRWVFFIFALAVFTQMAGVALRHSAWGWLE